MVGLWYSGFGHLDRSLPGGGPLRPFREQRGRGTAGVLTMPAGSEFERKLRQEDDRVVRALERIARALEKLVDLQEVKRAMWKSGESREFIGIDPERR